MIVEDFATGIALLLASVAILAAGLRTAVTLAVISAAGVGVWMLLWIGGLEGVLFAAKRSEWVSGTVAGLTSTALGQALFGSAIGALALALTCAPVFFFRGRRPGNGTLVAALVCAVGTGIALQPIILRDVTAREAVWALIAGASILAFFYAPLGVRTAPGRER